MALGIESNSIAPRLIQDSGNALVQNIRQIGQQVSNQLTEVQTRRDMAAMAQEMQGLNVQSNEFPIQLMQLATRHPLALNDQRGKMAMQILGKSHSDWRDGEQAAMAFQRQMQMQDARAAAARTAAEEQEERIRSRPTRVPGVGLADPLTGEVLVPELPRQGSMAPRVLSPGGILVDPTGKKLAENPRPEPTMTPYQRESLRAREVAAVAARKKANKELLMRQDKDASAELSATLKRLGATQKMISDQGNKADPNLMREAEAIMREADVIKQRKAELQRTIEQIESVSAEAMVAEDLSASTGAPVIAEDPDAGTAVGVLPPQSAVPATASNGEWVSVIDPQGKSGRVRASQLEAALQGGYKRR